MKKFINRRLVREIIKLLILLLKLIKAVLELLNMASNYYLIPANIHNDSHSKMGIEIPA